MLGNVIICAGLAGLTATITLRWLESGYPPFSNMTESLLWMCWAFCVLFFGARFFTSLVGLELVASIGVSLILALTTLIRQPARPLMPALQSNWLIFHVFTCMVAYAAFFAAFCAGSFRIFSRSKGNRTDAEILVGDTGSSLDELIPQLLAFGFLLLTIGIISGAVWARQAWGRYWGWDPKETWSLVTWLVYGIYLHLRRYGAGFGLDKRRAALLSAIFAIIGFLFVIFTYFGVSYLLPSLHSYA
jgi:cytochrome c-type biogenesis protein CcsB